MNLKRIVITLGAIAFCLLQSCRESPSPQHRLRISQENPHYLAGQDGKPVFLNGDTAWKLAIELDREQIRWYLETRKEQGFNTVGLALLFGQPVNLYGDPAFHEGRGGRPDPARPLTTGGSDPEDAGDYDYWDHVDYALEEIRRLGMYAGIVVSFNSWVINPRSEEETLFDTENAYHYGNWVGQRYRRLENTLWFMGGDRPPVLDSIDRRDVFAAMAEGLADGLIGEFRPDGQADYSTHLISYHPRKREPRSSTWFHNSDWQTFNSVQACPYDQVTAILGDFSLEPVKPTWLWEGRYEGYRPQWDGWTARYQAYQTVFSGGFGHVYGNKRLWQFAEGWVETVFDEGALDMKHLAVLMEEVLSDEQYLGRVPCPDLVIPDTKGKVDGCWKPDSLVYSSLITACRGPGFVFVYTPDGSGFSVETSKLPEAVLSASWFNPRYGLWHSPEEDYDYIERKPFLENLNCGPGTGTVHFNPPYHANAGNDWVLVLMEK